MAAFDPAPYLGAIGITDAEWLDYHARDTGLSMIGASKAVDRGRIFSMTVPVFTTANNNTKESAEVVAPFPFKVLTVYGSAETAGGTTGTMNMLKALAATPTTFATMLEAAIDVKTTVGKQVAGSVTSGKEDFDVGDRFKAQSISGSAADQTGAMLVVWAIRT